MLTWSKKPSMTKTLPTEPQTPQKVSTRFLRDAFAQSPIDSIPFVNTLLRESASLQASDLLLEPMKAVVRIRAKIDGVFYELGEITHDDYPEVSSRIKILAKLDPTEKRKIQEGQLSLDIEGRAVNLRVEIAQTVHGEVIVIRIHEKRTIIMELSELGFNAQAYQNYQEMLNARSGLILVCGPTGCGKTTTLYSTISKINLNQNYNIMTIEDPVEFQLPGVNQMQTNAEAGFSFAEGLRTLVRLSPDIILVGEIRDKETAEIAVESGLTGQLVLSTIHAGDAVGALFRLLDLGIETYLLNSSILGIVAQRLVRRVCPECNAEYQASPQELDLFQKILGRPPKKLVKGKGCLSCQDLGYQGRTGIYEVLTMTARMRDLIRAKANEDILRDTLQKEGFISLFRDGLEKCEQGITTPEEVLRNSIRKT